MSSFARFVTSFVSGLIAAYLGWTMCLWSVSGTDTSKSFGYANIAHRKLTILSKERSPRLVILAGSSAMWGISATEISKHTTYNPVNLGINAGISLPFYLWIAKENLRPGDAVLLPLEYGFYNYHFSTAVSRIDIDFVLGSFPNYFEQLETATKLKVPLVASYEDFSTRLMVKLSSSHPNEKNTYTSKFNHLGDIEGNDPKLQTEKNREEIRSDRSRQLMDGISDNSKSWDLLRDFIAWCSANNVRVISTFPNLCYQPDYENSPHFRSLPDQIHRFYQINGVPFLGTFQDSLYPPECFFDTIYHLNAPSVSNRTSQIINWLRQANELQPR
jgi:hypothetical protein